MSITPKTVLVTGGTRGIGAAIVERLLKDPEYSVVLTGNHAQTVEATRLRYQFEPRVRCLKLDVTDDRQIDACVTELTRLGDFQLYGLVNNAGMNVLQRIDEFHGRTWQRVLEVNLFGTMKITQAFLPFLTTPGRIVNVSSQLSKTGRVGCGAYCASKAGINLLTETWSRELASRLTVNAVCPGWIATEMVGEDMKRGALETGTSPEKFAKSIHDRLDQGRFNTPEEVAQLVHFLLSEGASGISGRAYEMAGPTM